MVSAGSAKKCTEFITEIAEKNTRCRVGGTVLSVLLVPRVLPRVCGGCDASDCTRYSFQASIIKGVVPTSVPQLGFVRLDDDVTDCSFFYLRYGPLDASIGLDEASCAGQ